MTQKLTITEALAEIKTVGKRLETKRQFINTSFAGDSRLRDPYAEEGGWTTKIRRELQAIDDLEERIVKLRSGIATANAATTLTMHGTTRTLSDWLVWRREVAPTTLGFYRGLRAGLEKARAHKFDANEEARVDLYIDPETVQERLERMDMILGELDGKLSLLNATTFIDL
jgi:hypothetical protein